MAIEIYNFYNTRVYQDVVYPYPPVHSTAASYSTTTQVNRNKLPNYRKIIAERKDASLPYLRTFIDSSPGGESSSTKVKYTDSSVYPPREEYRTAWSRSSIAVPNGFMPAPPSLDDECDSIALKKLRNRLSEANPHFSTLPFVGEGRELVGLVSQIAHLTTNPLRGLVNLHNSRGIARDIYKRASEIWLNYSFAVTPLLSDAESLAATIANQVHKTGTPFTMRFRGSSSRNWSTTTRTVQAGAQGLTHKVIIENQYHYKVRYTAGHLFNLSTGYSSSFATNFGLRPADILPAIWELTPYSWVVDYFTNVGDVLDSAFTSQSGKTIYCCKSTYSTHTVKASSDSYTVANGVTVLSASYRPSSLVGTLVKRDVFGAIPVSGMRFKSLREIAPSGDNLGVSIKRLLNLASLLAK